MRAVVVFESMCRKTHRIADAIGAELETAFDVRVVPVSQAGPEVIAMPTWPWSADRRTLTG